MQKKEKVRKGKNILNISWQFHNGQTVKNDKQIHSMGSQFVTSVDKK